MNEPKNLVEEYLKQLKQNEIEENTEQFSLTQQNNFHYQNDNENFQSHYLEEQNEEKNNLNYISDSEQKSYSDLYNALTGQITLEEFKNLDKELEEYEKNKKKQTSTLTNIKTKFNVLKNKLNTQLSNILKTNSKKDLNSYVFNFSNEKKYKKKHRQHSNKSVEQWKKYYEFLIQDGNYDYKLFVELLKHNGIADIRNNLLDFSNNKNYYHKDYFFFKEIENLLKFTFKKPTRINEIIEEYLAKQIHLLELSEIDLIKKQIEDIETKCVSIKKISKRDREKINKKIKNEDSNKKYDEVEINIDTSSLTNEEKKTYIILKEKEKQYFTNVINYDTDASREFEKIIQIANIGVLTLNYGDFILDKVFEKIAIENFHLYFLYSLVYCDWDFLKRNFKDLNLQSIKENLEKLNKETKSTKKLFSVKVLEDVINKKEEISNKIKQNLEDYYKENKGENLEENSSLYFESYLEYLDEFDIEKILLLLDLETLKE